ncbi:MAG TPA: ABC transporter permease [Gemmatimonadaceae bacterium]|nr:ABC transporter permease [Gemmatimonadaceae bacterium]
MRPRFLRLPRRSSRRIRADLEEELRFYFDMRTRELVDGGIPEAEARREAIREFGDLEFTTRYCLAEDAMSNRDTHRADRLAELRQDVVHTWRTLRRAPAFTAVALVTLALGIGATTAIFSAVNGLLLRDLPYRDADAVVRIWGARFDAPDRAGQISVADFLDLRARQRSFTTLGAFAFGGGTYVGPDEAVPLPGLRVEPQVMQALGIRPYLGRVFTLDDVSAANPVIILAYGTWQRLLAGDSGIIGRTVNVSGQARTVVGVLPPAFFFPSASETEIYTPLDLAALQSDPVRARRFRRLGAVGRLRDEATVEGAQVELVGIMRQLEREMPETNTNMSVLARSARDAVVGDVRPPLLVLFGASVLVLLIACANVAGMLLSRAVGRRQEIAVRAALGAGRGRLVRQMLTESLVLACCGAVGGILVAIWGSRALGTAARGVLPVAGLVRVDATVLVSALLVTFACGLAFGLVPAMSMSRELQAALRGGSTGTTAAAGGHRLRTALVTGQLALSVVLLVGAGLLTRSLLRLQGTDLGYDLDSAFTFEITLAGDRYRTVASHDQFFDALYEGIRALPGVVAAGGSGNLPLRGGSSASFAIEGQPRPEERLPEVGYQPVSDEWFAAMRIPLRRGRSFTRADHDSAPGVVILSEGLARTYWPGGDPIGARVRLGPDSTAPWGTVVGVVGDVRTGVDGEARPTAYVSARQDHWGGAAVVVRTTGSPGALLAAVRHVVRGLDPALPIAAAGTLRHAQAQRLADRRLPMQLLSAFALLALALASVGVYGVMAFSVAARSREIGVRMALGARPASVFRMVLRQGIAAGTIGAAIGLAGAIALGRMMAGLLYGVGPVDLPTMVVSVAVLLLVALGASLVPARRAVRVDPLTAMRAD